MHKYLICRIAGDITCDREIGSIAVTRKISHHLQRLCSTIKKMTFIYIRPLNANDSFSSSHDLR